jgi:hypothetical protein
MGKLKIWGPLLETLRERGAKHERDYVEHVQNGDLLRYCHQEAVNRRERSADGREAVVRRRSYCTDGLATFTRLVVAQPTIDGNQEGSTAKANRCSDKRCQRAPSIRNVHRTGAATGRIDRGRSSPLSDSAADRTLPARGTLRPACRGRSDKRLSGVSPGVAQRSMKSPRTKSRHAASALNPALPSRLP